MVIFVDQSRDHGFSAGGPQVGHVAGELCRDVRRPLLSGLVRPVAVVVVHILAKHQCQVALIEDQGPVQQLAAQGPDDALAAPALSGQLTMCDTIPGARRHGYPAHGLGISAPLGEAVRES